MSTGKILFPPRFSELFHDERSFLAQQIDPAVKEGKGISLPMRSAGIFPPLATHMIRVGEETGRMEEMLIRVADTYDREVQNAVKRFIAFLEPALILVMALLVGFIVMSIVWAIFSINDISF